MTLRYKLELVVNLYAGDDKPHREQLREPCTWRRTPRIPRDLLMLARMTQQAVLQAASIQTGRPAGRIQSEQLCADG